MSVRTRFAPSPTGFMHVGGVRTALFAWLFARKHGGQFLLRIEDTDKEREVEGSVAHIIESLTWLGIEWDEGVDKGGPYAPYIQSERLDSYKKYAELLVSKGLAYPDPYSPEELEAFRAKAEEENLPFLYRKHRPEVFGEWDGKQTLRFKIPEIKRYTWTDLVRGELSAGEEALDDFVLMKADGYPTYNFAHIIDDLEMKITHIMRGDEFISSTPKFLALYEALEIERPQFATMPVILGPDGKKKLGKRDGAKDLLDYEKEGILPEAMMNFLALLGWHPSGDEEILSVQELISAFDVSHVQGSPAKLDETKLHFINQHRMRLLSDEAYLSHLAIPDEEVTLVSKLLPILRERAQTFQEAREMLVTDLSFVFVAPTPHKELLTAKEPGERPGCTKEMLSLVLATLRSSHTANTAAEFKDLLMPIADLEEAKGKGGRGAMLWPLRYALSALERSPDPFMLLSILGLTESISRVETALAIL